MSYYEDVYLKRLNRYGTDYQSRVQGQREREFEDYLLKSIYRVDFNYEDELHPGTLEKFKQDESETIGYLLTRISLDIENGTILMIPDKDKVDRPWMIWWKEEMKASGYNRYVVLKMTNLLIWTDEDGQEYSQWAYFYGPGNKTIQATVKSKTGQSLYLENDNEYIFITSTNKNIKKETYFEVSIKDIIQPFKIILFDVVSTPGVEYISVDPVYKRDSSPKPEKKPSDSDADFYWLNGGAE